MPEDYVARAAERLRQAKAELTEAEASSTADPDRIAALRAIVGNRERQLASVRRAAAL